MFNEFFESACNALDARYRGMSHPHQNPADRGELCEVFVSEFLEQFLTDNFRIVRGGQLVDRKFTLSSQLDVILIGRNYLRIFADKGLYPIETVAGVFCVTSTLSLPKLQKDIAALRTIPKKHVLFHFQTKRDNKSTIAYAQKWNEEMPYKCVFAFDGAICSDWADFLRQLVRDGIPKSELPDVVVVNKRGYILKVRDEAMPLGRDVKYPPHFRFFDVSIRSDQFTPLPIILNKLYRLSLMQNDLVPHYQEYFIDRKDEPPHKAQGDQKRPASKAVGRDPDHKAGVARRRRR